MPSDNFWADFKRATEEQWRRTSINPAVYGFQLQPGTRWNPGLPDRMMAEYEIRIDVRFPEDFKELLRTMNGTDFPTLNVYGGCGEPPRQSVGVYSYPRDINLVRQLIENVTREREPLTATMAEQGFELLTEAALVPIHGHRYLVCTSNPNDSIVLSIQDGSDAIVYENSSKEYLQKEFL